ncbi:WD40/YVTN/BNR-like repeat-containing protein [Hyphomicrobium sp. 2TAF46]|uniref:WD40/YVTN/BNR-like repeat-containing protein n=1 Tax=Hyphomicrobium sp. 2TAF46 TaxID=3233019 RepID=UPI003F92FB1A
MSLMTVSAALLVSVQSSSPLKFSIHDWSHSRSAQIAASDSPPTSTPGPTINPMPAAVPAPSVDPLASQQKPPIVILQGDIALKPNKSFKFVASVDGDSGDDVIWSVRESAAGGSISAEGIYSAPSTPGVYHVAATSAARAKSDEVTVTVTDAIPWQKITPPISLDFNNPPNNYGTQIVLSSPSQPTTLYVGTNYQGVWKSFNSGKTWFKANVGLPTNPNAIYFDADGRSAGKGDGCESIEHRNWAMAIDPTDANVVYTSDGFGCAQGLWKTTNGGATWQQMFSPAIIKQSTNDIGSIHIDPSDHLHVLVGSHSAWARTPRAAGVWESRDGGKTWNLHPLPEAVGPSYHHALFLDSKTWIVHTQDTGIWRSADSGVSWNKVSSFTKCHGGSGLYRSRNGVVYLGGNNRLLRSEDFGLTWSDAGAPFTQDGYMGVVGDGTYIYTASANTGTSTTGPVKYYYSIETDGTSWKPYNSQTFSDGPMSMTFDRQNGVVFSSNWGAGVWKLTGR